MGLKKGWDADEENKIRKGRCYRKWNTEAYPNVKVGLYVLSVIGLLQNRGPL